VPADFGPDHIVTGHDPCHFGQDDVYGSPDAGPRHRCDPLGDALNPRGVVLSWRRRQRALGGHRREGQNSVRNASRRRPRTPTRPGRPTVRGDREGVYITLLRPHSEIAPIARASDPALGRPVGFAPRQNRGLAESYL
jgi:hypothetical protein